MNNQPRGKQGARRWKTIFIEGKGFYANADGTIIGARGSFYQVKARNRRSYVTQTIVKAGRHTLGVFRLEPRQDICISDFPIVRGLKAALELRQDVHIHVEHRKVVFVGPKKAKRFHRRDGNDVLRRGEIAIRRGAVNLVVPIRAVAA